MYPRRMLVVALSVAVTWLASSAADAASPTRSEAVTATSTTEVAVNINTADVKALMKLEGVGRKVAEKIVEYRESHGPFKKPEEIRKVEGIGSGLWERNRARIVVK